MNNYQNDAVTESFIANYGIISALEDIGVDRYQKTNEDEIIANCPFHEDNKPSFAMNLTTGMFTCFGCNASGNLYQFIQLAYNLDWKNAKDYLLSRSGLSENTNINDINFKRSINQKISKMNKSQEVDFQFEKISENMITRMNSAEDPHNYLENRGFSKDTIKYFECGYTKDYLGKGYNNQERITIPGHDEYGNICGFIGRTPVNAQPKYLYTSGYPKSHTLFNLHRASKYASHGLILVEGSLDVMRLHDLGYPNAVAILGAKLSEYQLKLLFKYTNKIFLMFDSDEAGKNANLTALEMTKDLLDVYYVSLKGFKDPGEIPNKETLEELLSKAKNWHIYIIQKRIQNKLCAKDTPKET